MERKKIINWVTIGAIIILSSIGQTMYRNGKFDDWMNDDFHLVSSEMNFDILMPAEPEKIVSKEEGEGFVIITSEYKSNMDSGKRLQLFVIEFLLDSSDSEIISKVQNQSIEEFKSNISKSVNSPLPFSEKRLFGDCTGSYYQIYAESHEVKFAYVTLKEKVYIYLEQTPSDKLGQKTDRFINSFIINEDN